MSKLIQTEDSTLNFVLEVLYVSELVERETQSSPSVMNEIGIMIPGRVLNPL